MKYKTGDRVRIVSEVTGDYWDPSMNKWLGKVMTIARVENCFYWMKEDEDKYGGQAWYDHMIAGLAEEPQHNVDDESKKLSKEHMDLVRKNYDQAKQISELKYRHDALEELDRERVRSLRRSEKRILELEAQNKKFLEIIKNFSKMGIER